MAQKSAKPPTTGESHPPPLPGSGSPPPLPGSAVPPPLPTAAAPPVKASERPSLPPPLPKFVHEPKVQVEGIDAETLQGRGKLPSSVEIDMEDLEPPSSVGAGSIDKLLALTGESWNVDDQVRTLKDANAPTRRAPDPPSKPRGLVLPTPYDIGKPRTEIPPPGPPGPESTPAPAPTSASKPPPLASRGSKQPPPLPVRFAPPPPSGSERPEREARTSNRPPPIHTSPSSMRPPAQSMPPTSIVSSLSQVSQVSQVTGQGPVTGSRPPDGLAGSTLAELLQARVVTLEAADDRVGLARAHIEMAIASEVLGDESKSVGHAEAALRVDSELASAHGMLRRRKHARGVIGTLLAHLQRELSASTAEASTVELIVERARLLEASGEKSDAIRAAWDQALTRAPHHAAALKGLESELVARTNADFGADAYDALAGHLGRMADAYASEPRLAAWLHVERAHILERRLGRVDAARGALERAVRLDPGVGPVRDAYVSHISAQRDMPALVEALEEEAGIETSGARSARLELEAATIADRRLKDDAKAVSLLERALTREPTTPSVDRRVLDELVRLYEATAMWPEAARARRQRLRYVHEPAHVSHELRTLAMVHERLGDLEGAIADIQRAMTLEDSDPTLVETLDRLLGMAVKDEQRMALWLTESARTEDGKKRARALCRAAVIADGSLQRPVEAIRHLRAAWVASPGDSETLDMLSRLLSPAPSQRVDGDVRALIDLYQQATQSASDPGRRVTYLERVALLWEELIGDAQRAARAYEEILSLEPGRRSAVLGLARNAARCGDERGLARALLDEAKIAADGVDVLVLKVRAATALARHDPARALAIVQEVLAADAAHGPARALEVRLHEESSRWEAAARAQAARIDHTYGGQERFPLWLSLAQMQDTRLRAPLDALKSLRQARALDPAHPVPPAEIARVLEATGDDRALRDALIQLASDAPTREERARFLVRAAEIDELRLENDESASMHYSRALAETPEDDMVADRLTRVLARRGAVRPTVNPSARVTPAALGERAAHLAKRYERAGSPQQAQIFGFEYAALLVELDQDLPHATSLLESILAAEPSHIPALRTLEAIARRTAAWAPLARVLSKQGDALVDVRGRLGALWNLAALEEWRLPATDTPTTTYTRILDLDPTDPGALEATVRRDLGLARRGDARARKAVISALRALCALASDDGSQLAMQLRLALLLESQAADGDSGGLAREALDRYRAALSIDPASVTAATGLARLSNKLGDAPGAVEAAMSLAGLATAPKAKARYLLDAAEILLGSDGSERLGPIDERQERAGRLLEDALESEPDSIPAAGRLATIRIEQRQAERLVETFRSAIARARSPDAIVMLGSEIARVARDELGDLTLGIEAMRRVRESAPSHVPSLLLLSELCIAQRAWPEAVEALEAVNAISREPAPRLTALFALASVYEKVLARPDEAERVLRVALTIEPTNARALRALIHRLATSESESEDGRPDAKREIADMLYTLADVERDEGQKSTILLELTDIRLELGDRTAAERALIDAVAYAPRNHKAFAKLGSLFRTRQGRDVVSYARALTQVVARGQKIGHVDPRWLAALGQLEIEGMGRVRDGVVHLQKAVQMDPTLYETRFELASAYKRLGANDEATRVLMSMLLPNPRPILSVSDPATALELLETTLGAERKTEDALIISELRAICGDLDEGRHDWLRKRRLPPLESHHTGLDRAALVSHVLPNEGRHVLLEVAAAIAGVESKLLRADLTELGISPRDRIGSRSGHPTRALLDRLARAIGVAEVDLVVTPQVTRTRVLAQDSLWVVVPKTLTELPEPTQLASLARALARVALGVPWLEELPPPHVEALLVASARTVVPKYGVDDIDVIAAKLVAQYEPGVAKTLSRKQRKLLEELSPHLSGASGRPIPVDTFIGALARAELRVAYLLTGDLLATIDELRGLDPTFLQATDEPGRESLAKVLEHTFAGDVIRFALTPEATALRRRVAATWT